MDKVPEGGMSPSIFTSNAPSWYRFSLYAVLGGVAVVTIGLLSVCCKKIWAALAKRDDDDDDEEERKKYKEYNNRSRSNTVNVLAKQKPKKWPCYVLYGLFQQVQIIDTSGSNEFPAMQNLNIRNGDDFVVVYAVDDPQSFHQALSLVKKVKDIKGKDFSRIILVGNKIDKTNSRKVTTEEVLKKSVTEEMLCFTETSAKLNCNIRCLFQIILRNYVKSDDLYFKKKNRKISKCKVKSFSGSCVKARKPSVQSLVYSLYTKNN
ncbi:GTP-binding protein Di-Ras2-like [Saccostrea cucullata]|uniref:GTP-binding protein Di-Ras2-like n=1 Tax=Saccostrea cuccullata TaxID=36930 RepID=UPI002ED67D39